MRGPIGSPHRVRVAFGALLAAKVSVFAEVPEPGIELGSRVVVAALAAPRRNRGWSGPAGAIRDCPPPYGKRPDRSAGASALFRGLRHVSRRRPRSRVRRLSGSCPSMSGFPRPARSGGRMRLAWVQFGRLGWHAPTRKTVALAPTGVAMRSGLRSSGGRFAVPGPSRRARRYGWGASQRIGPDSTLAPEPPQREPSRGGSSFAAGTLES